MGRSDLPSKDNIFKISTSIVDFYSSLVLRIDTQQTRSRLQFSVRKKPAPLLFLNFIYTHIIPLRRVRYEQSLQFLGCKCKSWCRHKCLPYSRNKLASFISSIYSLNLFNDYYSKSACNFKSAILVESNTSPCQNSNFKR